MSAQLLAADLSNLISDSKRKLPDLRQAAERSLSELKGLPSTSEAQLAADLSRRSHFIDPFLVACTSKNVKFAVIGVNCLQRLAVLSALPRARLKEVLDSIRDCSSLSQEVQLKILQILPTVLQNYGGDVRNGLLFSLLQTCSILQSSKTTAVSSTAAATFQQVLSSLFEELQREDAKSLEIPIVAEATGLNGTVQLRPVAHDALRVLQDLCLLAEGGKSTTIRLSTLPETSCLELVESILANYSELVSLHTELAYVLKSILLPHLVSTFREKRSFPITVRISRLLYMVVRNHNSIFPDECGQVLECFNHILEQNESQASWKRVICLEIYRGIFMEPHLILQLYSICDQQPGGKPIIRSCTASFVRLASEKPALIGLSQQSTVPIGNYFQRESTSDPSGDMSSAVNNVEGTAGVSSSAVPGISNQWSSVRSPFIDQLDKTDAPAMPETYVYSLVLLCLNNLAESLAKFVLPLTVQHSGKTKKRTKQKPVDDEDTESENLGANGGAEKSSMTRTASLKKRNVPVNPLDLESHLAHEDIKTAAALIDQCWPAILASCSTFFYAALDSDHYRSLVRSFQKFAQVAGLLRMSTPRDAFLTTLGKAAVPAHVLAAMFTPSTAVSTQSPSLLRSATGLLNVENLVNQASTLLPDRGRRSSLDGADNTLSSRNLLCLRALLNLAIALGPTLDGSWSIIFETLQQADKIIATVNLRPVSRDPRSNHQTQTQVPGETQPAQSQVISSEIAAIQAATSRLFESTVDFPNESFVPLLKALCAFVDPPPASSNDSKSPPPTPSLGHRRVSSFAGVSTKLDTAEKDFVFALSKIRELATANLDRFVNYEPAESGWQLFATTITTVATHVDNPSTARMLAAELLSHLTRDIISVNGDEPLEQQNQIRLRAVSALSSMCIELDELAGALGTTDDTSNEVHAIVLETLRAIIEQIGDTLVNGWDIVFDIIRTAFVSLPPEDTSESARVVGNYTAMKTIGLGRSAFGSVQLICSDFLSSVPDSSLLTLIDTIHRFASQHLDLNMSLTAATLFWNISDLLYGRLDMSSLDDVARAMDPSDRTPLHGTTKSLPELWIHLLSRIRLSTGDSREEVRTGSISTLIRIFDNHGDDLSADAWQLVLQSILLLVLREDAQAFSQNNRIDTNEVKGLVTTTKLVLEGMAKLLSTYIDVITTCRHFSTIWTELTSTFALYLSHEYLTVDQAVFDAMTTILSTIDTSEKVGSERIHQVARIWAEYDPTADAPADSNQDAYLSYMRSFQHIYRLSDRTVTVEVIEGIVSKMRHVIRTSGASAYSSDKDSMTKLQKEVLDAIRLLRTDLDGASSCIVTLYADFIALPFSGYASGKGRPSFVALAKASMDSVSTFASKHIERRELFKEALLGLITALEMPIRLKYSWKLQGKNPVLWQKATSSALMLLEFVIPRLEKAGMEEKLLQGYWDVVVAIGKGIASAKVVDAAEDAPILQHEDFDIDALAQFTKIIIPALGSERIPDLTRRTFARALFDSSIIHQPETDELSDLDNKPLQDLYHIRFGRTYNPDPVLRESMAYHCMGDLISLVSKQDASPERIKLAQAAAPYLILRTAITLRLYVADHPLRGRFMPLPFSQREELLSVLKNVRELESEPKAIPATEGLKTQTKRHLVRLYPLVVKAIEVEGRRANPDEQLIEQLRAILEAVGTEFIL